MYIREKPIYPSFSALWAEAYRSAYFSAADSDASPEEDLSLSERLLFTQSNGRTLLGQDTMGRLHFICSSHDADYGIPSGGPRVGGQFGGHIGQFYQSDLSMLLGKLRYEIQLNNGLKFDAANEDSRTWYLDHFMPATYTDRESFSTRVFSLAPVLEADSRATSSIHPLPGPCGAIFGMDLTNTGAAPLRGSVKLRLDPRFIIDNEEYGMLFEEAAVAPYRCEWDRKLLTMWRPDAYATVQLLDAVTSGDADNPQIEVAFELAAGESRRFIALVTATAEKKDAHRALGILYQHTPLEWINITADFWAKRFGDVSLGIREDPELGPKYRDMHLRFVLDDFNCLMFNEQGRMLANWQGAPSHGLNRLWGIDIEPTVISVMYMIPEIGPSAIEYMMERNIPRFSIYSDHSMPIYIAPLAIAGKYLELTGDIGYFRDTPRVMDKLRGHVRVILAHKHPDRALISSRYASDLIVFNKYDYSTNVKCFYALRSFAEILKGLGEDAAWVEDFLSDMLKDLRETMEGDGPFGRQITGGANLDADRDERFFIPDDIYYYGGEDSFTCMAPLYGLYEFNYAPWVNLHRYARSLFITNYDLEYESMRELHYGMNPSATGNTLRLGGSVTRAEMLKSLDIMNRRLDVSGSLFWWPRSKNKRRCLTRCSQGQGSWIQQSFEQWLGLRMDGMGSRLTIRPQGLIDQYTAKGIRVGAHRFDIEWREGPEATEVRVTNRNDTEIAIRLGLRAYGAGCEDDLEYREFALKPGETLEESMAARAHIDDQNVDVGRLECEAFAEDGAVFGPYGMVMPMLYGRDCDIFLLRYALVNATDDPWAEAEVELTVPEGFMVAEKEFFVWNFQPRFEGRTARVRLKDVEPRTHRVAGFYVLMPARMAGGNGSVMLTKHPFRTPGDDPEALKLLIGSRAGKEAVAEMAATLKTPGGLREVKLPVEVMDIEAYKERYDVMLHG